MPEDRLGEVPLQQKGGAGSCPWGADGYGMSRVLDVVNSWKGVYVWDGKDVWKPSQMCTEERERKETPEGS